MFKLRIEELQTEINQIMINYETLRNQIQLLANTLLEKRGALIELESHQKKEGAECQSQAQDLPPQEQQ